MTLALDLRFTIGARALHTTLTSSCARVAIVGPSGVGKTTLLRAIVGTLEGVRGRLVVRDEVFLDASVALSPERRRIGWVPQDAALFP